jgi:hypothetical protein
MNTKFFTLFAALLLTSLTYAQTLIKNDGATIVVQAGATLYVEGGIENTATGTITNDGTIEVQGDFLNNGTFDDTNGQLVKMSGDASADMTTNGDFIKNLEIAKTGGATVNLQDALTVSASTTFTGDDNRVVLGANNMTLQSGASLTGHDANHFVVTDGAGTLTRESLGTGLHAFPVGYTAGTYNPASLNVTAGTDNFSVRGYDTPTDGDGETGTAIAADVVGAGWEINSGGSATTDVILQWSTSDELAPFDRTMSGVAKNDGAGWDLLAADLGAATDLGGGTYTQTRMGVSSFSNFAVGAKPLGNKLALTLDLWLQGAYNGVNMNTGLITTQLPAFNLTEPYTGYSYVQKAFGGGETTTSGILTANNVVDWVLIELRDAVTNSLILGTKAGLLLNNGMVANPDGTVPVTVDGLAPGNYFVVVKHKNSLSAMTANPVDFTSGSAIVSFKGNVGVLGGVGAQADLTGGHFGLFHSDLDGTGAVDAGDRSAAWNDRDKTGYERSDADLSGSVDAGDRSAAWNNRDKTTAVPIGN